MARAKKEAPRREDWQPIESVELTDGSKAIKWSNIVTGEEAMLREGNHPFDNPNSNVRQVFPIAAVSAESEPEEIESDSEETPTDRVAAMLSKVAGKERAVLKVKRFQDDGTLAWCADLTPEQFEQTGYEGIRRDFGSGKYELTLYATNPATRKFSRYGYEVITLLAASKETVPASDALLPVLNKLVERIEKLESKPAPDPMQQMQMTLGLMAQMREALGLNHPPQQQQGMGQAIKEIASLLQITKQIREEIEPPPPPDTSLESVGLEALKVIGQMVAQKPDSGVPIPNVAIPPQLSIEQAALAVAKGTDANLLRHSLPSMPERKDPIDPQPPGETMSASQTAVGTSPEMLAFQEAITGLNAFARFNANPQTIAEMIFEQAPDEVLDLLTKSEDWFEQVKSFAPSVAEHEAWYRKVHAALLKIWQEENSPPDLPPAA